jgi:RimJ/RimL family protein N-acetyltransferase
MYAKVINNADLFEEIKTYLSDDTGEIESRGEFVGVFDGDCSAGVYLVSPWNQFCYQIHGGVGKEYWGRGPEVCWYAGNFIFNTTPCIKIVAIIPEFNRLMCKCVAKLGMIKEGKVTKSYLKWSRLHDQIIYGITKTQFRQRGDLCHQQQ